MDSVLLETAASTDWTPITIYTFSGSQYSAKVLTALDAMKVPHYVTFVSLAPSKRKLPLTRNSGNSSGNLVLSGCFGC